MATSARLLLLVGILLSLAGPVLGQQTTTISDNLVGPNATGVTGTIVVTAAQTFTSADGFVVPVGQRISATVNSNGSFSIALIPNLGASPSGTWYNVSYRLRTSVITEVSELWIVPQSATPVHLIAVRALNPPAPGLLITFPQNIPDASCAAIIAADPTARPVPRWDGAQWKCGSPNIGIVTMDLENPTAADSGKFQWKAKNALTLKRISCSIDQGAAAINLDIRQESSPNASGTQALASPLDCSTSTGATTTIANGAVKSLSPVALLVASASGGVTVVRVHVEYQLNP